VANGIKLLIDHPRSGDQVFANIFMPQGDVLAPVGGIIGIIWDENPPVRTLVATAPGIVEGSRWRIPFTDVDPGQNYSVEIIDAQSKVILAEVGPFNVVGVYPTIDINYPVNNGNFPRQATAYGPGTPATGSFYLDAHFTQKVAPNGSPVTPMPPGKWGYTFPGESPGSPRYLRVTDAGGVNADRSNITIT